jgi:dihydrolipoamide dehydrogenase
VCAIKLAQLGVRTAIIERDAVGGVCLNVGCIPSKALIEASKRFAFLKSGAAEMGISVENPSIQVSSMQAWKSEIVRKLTGGVATLLRENGATIIHGDARFDGPGTLIVTGPEGQQVVKANAIVVATGSRPIQIPGFAFDNESIFDSTGILALKEVPRRLLVIGGGYIGLEMGGVYARIGSQVTIVEMMDQILPGAAKDLIQPVARKFKALGTEILLETKALGYEKTPTGLAVKLQNKEGKELIVETDAVLVTVGRRPNTETLGLAEIGVELDRRGFIPVDDQLRTKVPGVYAIGDVVGDPMLAHKASKEGEVCAEVIAGHHTRLDVRGIPAVVFTDPEIAYVGLSEVQAKAKGIAVKTGKFAFPANGRALTTGKPDGFVRAITNADTDELVGVEIVGPDASDLIAEATLALEMGASSEDVGLTVHAHPTLSEAIMEAANAARGEAIHAINR